MVNINSQVALIYVHLFEVIQTDENEVKKAMAKGSAKSFKLFIEVRLRFRILKNNITIE